MNRQRGSSSDLAVARIQWLAPNAVRMTRYARHLPPDRPWLRHVLLHSDLTGLGDLSGLTVQVREGIVHVQMRGGVPCNGAPLHGTTILAEAHAPRRQE